MIEIRFFRGNELQTWAESDGPDHPKSALHAARTLWDDDREAHPVQGAEKERRVVFLVDGEVVRVVEGARP